MLWRALKPMNWCWLSPKHQALLSLVFPSLQPSTSWMMMVCEKICLHRPYIHVLSIHTKPLFGANNEAHKNQIISFKADIDLSTFVYMFLFSTSFSCHTWPCTSFRCCEWEWGQLHCLCQQESRNSPFTSSWNHWHSRHSFQEKRYNTRKPPNKCIRKDIYSDWTFPLICFFHSDYVELTPPQVVTLPPGPTSESCFSGDIIDDEIALEPDEFFTLKLLNPLTPGAAVGNDETTVNIIDDDGMCWPRTLAFHNWFSQPPRLHLGVCDYIS